MTKLVMLDGSVIEPLFELNGVFYPSQSEFETACETFNSNHPDSKVNYKPKLESMKERIEADLDRQPFFVGDERFLIGYRYR